MKQLIYITGFLFIFSQSIHTVENKPAGKTAPITVVNTIYQNNLPYRHKWFGTFHPTFALSIIDGDTKTPIVSYENKVFSVENKSVSCNQRQISVNYTYSFHGGYRKGNRMLTFRLPTNKKRVELSFDWDRPDHVEITDAILVSAEELEPTKSKKTSKKIITIDQKNDFKATAFTHLRTTLYSKLRPFCCPWRYTLYLLLNE